jgi:hypothetical protein
LEEKFALKKKKKKIIYLLHFLPRNSSILVAIRPAKTKNTLESSSAAQEVD